MKIFLTHIIVWGTLLGFAIPALANEQLCPELTTLQRVAGYLSWQLLMGIAGSTLIGIGVFLFLGGFVRTVWGSFWVRIRPFADIFTYLLSFSLILAGWWTGSEYQFWPVLLGALLFGAAVQLMLFLRDLGSTDPRFVLRLYFVVWSSVAFLYNTTAVGFLAIGALVGLLGFSIIVRPLRLALGFEDEKTITSGTAGALVLLGLYLLQKILFPESTNVFKVFEVGVFWLGSLVSFLGLFILSNKWYVERKNANYLWIQVITVCCYLGGILIGVIFNVLALAGIAGVMLVFYFAQKIIEVKTQGLMGAGIKIILIGVFFSVVWYLLKQNEDLVAGYLTTSLPP